MAPLIVRHGEVGDVQEFESEPFGDTYRSVIEFARLNTAGEA